MRTAPSRYPQYLWLAASTIAVVVVTSAVTIKGDAAAKLPSPAQSIRVNASSRPAAVAKDSLTPAAQASQARMVAAYGKLPLSFEINQGQSDRRVKFLSRGSGYSLFLIGNEAVLALRKATPTSKSSLVTNRHSSSGRLDHATFVGDRAGQHSPMTTNAVLRMRLVGANVQAKATGLEELPGKSNYFIGKDPTKWRTNVPNYAKVKYANVYPGVDLVYYGNQRELEYDFVVQPGADPHRIRLALQPQSAQSSPSSALRIDRNGDLVESIAGCEVVFHKPVVYQPGTANEAPSDGAQATRPKNFVQGKYLLNGNRVAFEIAGYDKRRPLVIDPTLAYSSYLGGSNIDVGYSIAVDVSGNAYVTGNTSSSDFPTTPGAFRSTYGGGPSDAFVAKLNAAGSALIYSTYLGGSSFEEGCGIVVDASSNAYVAGTTGSSDFPTTPSAFQTTYGGGAQDAFVAKLSAAGSTLSYSTYLGGIADDAVLEPRGVAVDVSGDAYVTGWTFSSNFPTTPGAFRTTFSGSVDTFVSKLNAAGSALVYSTYLGETDVAGFVPGGIAVDASGETYVASETNSSNFRATPGAFQTAYSGGLTDAFITKLNTAGSALLYSTYLGGSGDDWGTGIAVDASGNAHVTGETTSSNFPTSPGAFQTTFGGSVDRFVSKLNADGSGLAYSTYLGEIDAVGFAGGIALNALGDAFVTGLTGSSNFPTTLGAFQPHYAGNLDAFVSKLNAAGSALLYSTYLGGSGNDYGGDIAIDASGSAYVTGNTTSFDFPTTLGAFQPHYAGNLDAFVSKLNAAGSALLYSTYLGGSGNDYGGDIAIDASGSAYVTGNTTSFDFPTTLGAFQTAFGGNYDAFVSKFSFPAGIPFSRFGGGLLIDPDAGVFYLSGGFKLGPGGSINPVTESVTFSVGDYSVTLPPGSFVKYKTGYVYQKRVNHIFLCMFIKFTSTPGSYALLANRIGGTLTSTTSPVPVTLAIGDNSGTADMKAKFD